MRRRSKLAIAFALSSLMLLAAGCVGVRNALTDPIKRTATFRLAALPRTSRPVRIALLSDIHVGNFVMTRERLEHIVSEVNESHPDVVLLAGDFVIGEEREGAAARTLDLAPLSDLKATNGVFAVFSNHDHWTDPEATRSSLRKAKIVVLENQAVRVGALAIVGIGDAFPIMTTSRNRYDKLRRLAECQSPSPTPQPWPLVYLETFRCYWPDIPIAARCFGVGTTIQTLFAGS